MLARSLPVVASAGFDEVNVVDSTVDQREISSTRNRNEGLVHGVARSGCPAVSESIPRVISDTFEEASRHRLAFQASPPTPAAIGEIRLATGFRAPGCRRRGRQSLPVRTTRS